MGSTALGAEKAAKIIFISKAHEKFYYEKLKEVRYQDVYHKALVYCLGISDDTRRNIKSIYDFKTGCVKTECLHEGWQTSGSAKVVRMAFNLYCNGTPSVLDYDDAEEQVDECKLYTVEELFCCAYATYFWQAVHPQYRRMEVATEILLDLSKQTKSLEMKVINVDERDQALNIFLKKMKFSVFVKQYEMRKYFSV